MQTMNAGPTRNMSKTINIIFPHQLFAEHPILEESGTFYLIEEFLFFQQYQFHKQKLAFHRATMKCYEEYLKRRNLKVQYIDATNPISDIRKFDQHIKNEKITNVNWIDPVDDWLEERVKNATTEVELKTWETTNFINSKDELHPFFRKNKKSFFQTSFYKSQRKKLNILLNGDEPVGGKWSFDKENRKKYPQNKIPPAIQYPDNDPVWNEAVEYVVNFFQENPGSLSKQRIYPIHFKESQEWLEQFFKFRFFDFGAYEDAIVKEYSILNHSVLSPLINVGLLNPLQVVQEAIEFSHKENVPINSTEGFVRQIIGWREFIRGMYVCKGRYSRTLNYWSFDRKIPESFYNATTGIHPVDVTIKKVLKCGYCHHIERLMVLGNFMLLCEFDPDEVYRWFMELFIDSYDWVMVPNVYGMSQFSDGGTFATKPYIGGSNYLKKMSNYNKGKWEDIWDGLFWRFIDKHQDVFSSNPRMGVLVHTFHKMSEEKKVFHLKVADEFLTQLDQ